MHATGLNSLYSPIAPVWSERRGQHLSSSAIREAPFGRSEWLCHPEAEGQVRIEPVRLVRRRSGGRRAKGGIEGSIIANRK